MAIGKDAVYTKPRARGHVVTFTAAGGKRWSALVASVVDPLELWRAWHEGPRAVTVVGDRIEFDVRPSESTGEVFAVGLAARRLGTFTVEAAP